MADDGALYGDADGDGYGDADTSYVLCDAPADAVSDATDCDDTDSGVHPGASETWYDGVDTDCAGDDDYDADGDGHTSDSYGGDDCDDTDAESRGAEADEVGLGVGPDCGTMAVVARVYGEGAGDHAGSNVSGGDVNGDGYSDILMNGGAASVSPVGQGASYLVLGPVSGEVSLSTAEARIGGTSDMSSEGGLVFDDPDLDGDGYADLLLQGVDGSSYETGHVFNGPLSGVFTVDDADARWAILDNWYPELNNAGDTDGDGFGDLLANWMESASTYTLGGVLVLTGPWSGDHDSTEAAARLAGDTLTQYCGYQNAGIGDVDGDGLSDVAMGCSHMGAALYMGPVSGEQTAGDADALLGVDWAGSWVYAAGDTNGDGYADVLMNTLLHPDEGRDAYPGVVYVLEGPFSGSTDVVTYAVTTWVGPEEDSALVVQGGNVDLDADGLSDFVLMDNAVAGEVRRLWIVAYHDPGVFGAGDSDWMLEDEVWPDSFVGARGYAGDLNLDGYDDMLLGTPTASVEALEDGAAWVLQGGPIVAP